MQNRLTDAEFELLERHARLFNEAIWTGDFGPMLEQFTDDAELVFAGADAAVGPFRGREAIAAAYRDRPPDDEVRVSNPRLAAPARVGGDGDGSGPPARELVVDYAWAGNPRRRAGEMRFVARGGRIARLTVTFT